MKKATLLISLLLAVLMVFSSCTGGESEITTEPEIIETEAPEAPPVYITKDGATEYKLIRSDKTSQAVTDAFLRLRTAINEKYGVKIEVGDDFVMPNKEPHAYEIAVGSVDREESPKALEGVGFNDSVIAFIGNRLFLTGNSDEAVIRAVDLFIEKYLPEGDLTVSSSLRVVEKAEYAKAGLTIGGVPISDYVIVYGSTYRDAAAEVANRLGILTGAVIPTQNEKEAPAEHEIAIGAASRATATSKGTDDFKIEVKGDDIHITALNKTAVEMACSRFCKLLSTEKTAYELSDLALDYVLPASRDYVNDIESLPLHWELEFQTPEWMLDYDEKYAASMDAGGRLMSCAHRGDMVYYPENSIEGIISSVMMGADMVEIDPRLTKDGVFILLHDATLTRTTNFEEMAGKNGLPTSANVADWTYEQLQQLNLKMGTGGASAKVTP
ncbi:MAG: glycerophosphodiester phosphodiesterase family protein [Clostridia bacterium]|nr:glycerophosphodiester phosphodiesterase family protein [Clostridia bacterium]